MTYTIEKKDASLRVYVVGHLDLTSSPVLEKALDERLEGIRELTIDLGKVDYVSSMGLRLLLTLQQRMDQQGSMQVVQVNDSIRELLDDTGFSEFLHIR